MKAIIIARVSTEEQKEAGNSLPAQIARQKKYFQNKGYPIEKEFSFDKFYNNVAAATNTISSVFMTTNTGFWGA